MKELVRLLRQWNREYYKFDAPTVSDAQYDETFRELQKLEAENPELILKNSPTQGVCDNFWER